MKTFVLGLLVLLGIGLSVRWFTRPSEQGTVVAPPVASFRPGAESNVAVTPPPLPEITLADWSVAQRNLPLSPKIAKLAEECTSGVVIDTATREILWKKNENTPVEIASMTKMMTVLLLMEAIHKEKRVTLETPVQVTVSASKIGGSQVYIDPKETFTLDELLKCAMIFSANDATQLIAEFLAQGNAELFVQQMNSRAQELGLQSMKFYNPHGLPPSRNAPENEGTALELAFLATRLQEYPEVVHWSSTWREFIRQGTPKPFELTNRNKLVTTCPGVNGMKTGYTKKSRFCVSATCERSGRKMICVVTGCTTAASRNTLVTALLDWAYAQPSVVAQLFPSAPAASATMIHSPAASVTALPPVPANSATTPAKKRTR